MRAEESILLSGPRIPRGACPELVLSLSKGGAKGSKGQALAWCGALEIRAAQLQLFPNKAWPCATARWGRGGNGSGVPEKG